MAERDDECWADYEAAIGPPPGAAARIRARVDRTIAGRERVAPHKAELPRAAAAIVVLKSSAMSVAIAVAALGGLHLIAKTVAPAPAELPAVAQASEPAPAPVGPTPPVAAASIPEVTPVESSPPPVLAPPTVARPRAIAPAAAPTPAVDTLAEETEIVARARAAIASGEWTRAQTLLADHARRFPRGVLAPERDAYTAIARCSSGARGSILATFTAAHPGSAYLDRVRAACEDSSTDRSAATE
jgi:hypothetical protein